jgi:hypothetical protein
MYHHNVKLSFKSFVSALLAVMLMAVAVSTQTTSPTYPRWPDIKRQNPGTINAQELGAIGPNATGQRPSIRDLMLGEEPPLARENLKKGNDESNAPAQQKLDPDRAGVSTIPHWSDTFTYHGLTYEQTMVGTDPRHGSATTIIPTVIIPLRILYIDGNVYDPTIDLIDGENPINEIRNSPIFQPTQINIGGVSMGNTQYGDAFQRANFWGSVSNGSHDYHVLLGQPTVLPAYEVNITGRSSFRNETIAAVRNANLPAGTLAIVLWEYFPS